MNISGEKKGGPGGSTKPRPQLLPKPDVIKDSFGRVVVIAKGKSPRHIPGKSDVTEADPSSKRVRTLCSDSEIKPRRKAPAPPPGAIRRRKEQQFKLLMPPVPVRQSQDSAQEQVKKELEEILARKMNPSKSEDQLASRTPPPQTVPRKKRVSSHSGSSTAAPISIPRQRKSEPPGQSSSSPLSELNGEWRSEFQQRKQKVQAGIVHSQHACSLSPRNEEKGSASPSSTKSEGYFAKLTGKTKTPKKSKRVTSLDEEQMRAVDAVKRQLNLATQEEAIRAIQGLNGEVGSTYDSGSASSSKTSTPVGSLEQGSMPRSKFSTSYLFSDDAPVMAIRPQLSSFFDYSTPGSAICLAIKAVWNKNSSELTACELERIVQHCHALLLVNQSEIPMGQEDVSTLLAGYLVNYERTAFQELFPQTCSKLGFETFMWREVVCDDEDFLLAVDPQSQGKGAGAIQLFTDIEKVLLEPVLSIENFRDLQYFDKKQKVEFLTGRVHKFLEELNYSDSDCESSSEDEGSDVGPFIRKDLLVLQARLEGMADALRAMEANDFRNQKNWNYCIKLMIKNGQNAAMLCPNPAAIGDVLEQITEWGKSQKCDAHTLPQMIKAIDKKEKELKAKFNLSDDDFEKARVQTARSEAAQIDSKVIHFLFDEHFHKLSVKHTPAALMNVAGEPVLVDPLNYQGHIVPSSQRDAPNAINMSVTTVDHEWDEVLTEGGYSDTCSREEEIKKEIRVGVPYAFAVHERDKREQVTHQRWEEILITTGLTFFPDQMAEAFNKPGVVNIPTFYNCLLSPDILRSIVDFVPVLEDERHWCQKIEEKVNSLNASEIELSYRAKKDEKNGIVKVKPNIFLFICPCNRMAFSSRWQWTGAWANADKVNQKTFIRLFGHVDPDIALGSKSYVQTFLDENPNLNPVLRHEIEELSHLLRYMFSHKLHHNLWDEPFIFPNAISELGHMLEVGVISGCKSAKDRTGNYERCNLEFASRLYFIRKKLISQLMAQHGENYLAWEDDLHQERILPPLGRNLSHVDIYNASTFMLCSGQFEMQMYNITRPGFKIEDYMLGFVKGLYPVVNLYLKEDKPTKHSKRKKASVASTSPPVKTICSSQGATTGFSPVWVPPDH